MKAYTILIALILSGFGAFAQYNTFRGTYAGRNTTGNENTFIGYSSGQYNISGSKNTFNGYQSGYNNGEGNYNVALGAKSGYNNKGHHNIFNGYQAGYSNFGSYNVFMGSNSGRINGGNYNTFLGYCSGYNNLEGFSNIFLGTWAASNNVTGSFNIAIGYQSGQTKSNLENSVAIGAFCKNTASNQVRIGNTNINSIGGQVAWSTLSDGRFKKNIEENVPGLDFINKLHPVSYEIDKEALDKFKGLDTVASYTDARTAPVVSTGFVAQEVEKLVSENNFEFHGVEAPQNENDNYAIRYSEFVIPLIKAVQEMSTIVERQQEKISELRSAIPEFSNMSDILSRVQLYQNIPNPFSSSTSIAMFLPGDIAQAEVHIIDIDGKILKKLPVSERGNTSITIEKGTLISGVYIYTLVVDGRIIQSKRLILSE